MTTKKALHISNDLALPYDIVTDTIGVLAVKGAGKTYAALVLFEEMVKAGLPVVGMDPVGVFWGLRSSADGKRAGLPVVRLGGKHADAPLEPRAGKTIADFVIAERAPCVLDLSGFETKAEHLTFAREFLERLYQKNRDALHVMIDEADDLAPQKPFGDEARVLRAVEVLVRRGRARGLGCTLITQRAAVLNKNVLTQCSTLILGRTVSPQDRGAIQAWVNAYGTDAQKAAVEAELASMAQSEKWIWSPDRGIFKRVHIRERETFDSSATPKTGVARAEPKALAEVDLEGLRSRISETIERAKADDPKELKRQVADLKKQVAAKAPTAAPVKAERVEVPVFTKAELELIADARARVSELCDEFREISRELQATQAKIEKFALSVDRVRASPASTSIVHRDLKPANVIVGKHAVHAPKSTRRPPADGDEKPLGAGERAILTAIAQHPGGCTPEHLTVLLGYKRSSRNTYLQKLSSAGLVERVSGKIVATDAGLARLGPEFEPLPTGKALRDHWLDELPEGERRILEILVADYPQGVTCEGLDEMTGYKRSSRNTYLQKLSSRELIERPGIGVVRASAMLFDGDA